MTRDEVDLAVDWAAAEGWNPGHHDADCFHAADRDGFLVGFLGNEPVAVISAVRYGRLFGFIGFYIVKPGFRGKGYGIQIWNAAMDRLKGRTIGLDGVVSQQENYRKSGFVLAHRNVRHQGIGGRRATTDRHITPLAALPLDSIVAYDSQFFPDDRSIFLRCWIDQPGATALGMMSNHRLTGYGVLRPCRTGSKIGPLFADSPAVADRLFAALVSSSPAGEPVFLDTPETNPAAMELARNHEMTPSFETARMYAGPAPTLPLDGIFGVTTFELG